MIVALDQAAGNGKNEGSDPEINSRDPIVLDNKRVSARCGADIDGDPQSCDTPFTVQVNNPVLGFHQPEVRPYTGYAVS